MSTDHLGALTLWAIAALLLLWAASAHLRRARDEAAFDRHCAQAEEQADWRADPTPTHDALLAEERFLPLHEAIARMSARRLDAEWAELNGGER